MKWSPQQAVALDRVGKWLRDPNSQVFYLAGYAGTGKTTIAKHLVEGVKCVQAAFTGKAASVLRTRGFPEATTLHSLMYKVQDASSTRLRELMEELREVEPGGLRELELTEAIKEEKASMKRPRFYLSEDSPILDTDLVLVDEVSMVGRDLGEDLLSFGKKVLVLGDPAQLPPVRGLGYFTSQAPDHTLTEIHRQAEGNPIIRWSKVVREGGNLPFSDEGAARKLHKADLGISDFVGAGQILTGKNVTRRKLNRSMRRALGREGLYPVKDDQLVILRNDREIGVLNGVVCKAAEDTFQDPDEGWLMLEVDYEGRQFSLDLDPTPFLAYRDPDLEEGFVDRSLMQVDFGYALTVHKSQGSQWSDIWIADDGFANWNAALRKKWLYTAITRAENTLTIVA